MHRLRTAKLAALLVGIAMVAAACGGGDDEGGGDTSGGTAQIQPGGTLNYAADQEPTGFNNNTSKDNGTSVLNIVVNMFPFAFHAQPDFTVKMDEAFLDSAEQTSEDPQTIVYKIKENAIWSDDTPITADDFVYFWEQQNGTIKDNDVASTTGYDQSESVEGSDNGKTVTVVFKNPYADWKGLFTGILPAHYVKERPGGWNTGLDKEPEKIPVGGWFKVENYTAGQSLTLTRNDKYFGPKSNLDSVVFRFLPESTTQPAALQNNEVDLIYPQPQLDQVQQVKALPDVTSEINFGLSFEHFDFNLKNEFLADEAVRKAIATGINVQELVDRTVKQFSDQAQPLGNRIYLTGQPEYQDHMGQYGKGDTAAATKLLEDAGYAKGADGIYAKGGKKISLRISTTAGNTLRETQGQLFQAQMKEIGVEIKIANLDSQKLFGEALPNGNFDIANFAWVGSPFAISGARDIF
ncbi:MAG TPA: ABC transporter family substrate-binding protein, partial [Actinomycetota bacterium]|nr:ABC transporter family substrate-binding protein [Actinomycetota bacterium]